MSGILGPGRIMGELLYGAGRRLEPVLDRMASRVAETFLYVLKTPNGSRLVINREHVATLKRSWGKFALPQTRRVERRNLVSLLGVRNAFWEIQLLTQVVLLKDLSGSLEVRVYPKLYSIKEVFRRLTATTTRGLKIEDGESILPDSHTIGMRRETYIWL